MPAPSTSLSTLRPDLAGSLEEFDLQADRAGFIGLRVLPVMEVGKPTGTFGKIPIEQLLQSPDTARAPGSGYSRGKWTFTKDSYTTDEHGWEEPVDDREAAMYREYIDAEMVSAARARDFVLRNYEIRAAALVFNTTTWSVTNITNEWDDLANATPIVDIEAAVQRVYAASGLWPNALILNRKVFRNLRNCAQIVDRLKYSGIDDPKAANISTRTLAQVFDLQDIIVAGSSKNTANEGQSVSLSSVWSDEYAMVARIPTSNDIREPGLGRTFHWGEDGSSIGATMESYRDETVRGDVIRARMETDEKILYAEAAQLIGNVTTI